MQGLKRLVGRAGIFVQMICHVLLIHKIAEDEFKPGLWVNERRKTLMMTP